MAHWGARSPILGVFTVFYSIMDTRLSDVTCRRIGHGCRRNDYKTGETRKRDKSHSPFANGYLPMANFLELIHYKLPMPLPIFYYFEFLQVPLIDGPASVLPPSLSESPKSYRFVIPGN